MAKFSKGDRVVICDEEVASKLAIASREGAIVQGDPDQGDEGSFQVMFDGDELPQWLTGAALKLIARD